MLRTISDSTLDIDDVCAYFIDWQMEFDRVN